MKTETINTLSKMQAELEDTYKINKKAIDAEALWNLDVAISQINSAVELINREAPLKIGDTVTLTDKAWDKIKNKEKLVSKVFEVYNYERYLGKPDITIIQKNKIEATGMSETVGLSFCEETREELLQLFVETYTCEKCSSFKGTENEGSFCSKECIKVMQERHTKSLSPIK